MSDDHLNTNRIRQMSALRRGAIRSRSYSVIALCACLVAAAECVYYAWRRWPSPINARGICITILYLACAALLVWTARHFYKLAMRLHAEARRSLLEHPAGEPDFSPLSDGSQIINNLEAMIDEKSPDDGNEQ